jgi:hypothetical protein
MLSGQRLVVWFAPLHMCNRAFLCCRMVYRKLLVHSVDCLLHPAESVERWSSIGSHVYNVFVH